MADRPRGVHFADEQTELNVTVEDVRVLAKLFDVDTSPRRLQLSGASFVHSVAERMFTELADYKLNERENEYLSKLFELVPTLRKYGEPFEFQMHMRVFNKWLSSIQNMDNLMPYILSQSDAIVIKPARPARTIFGSVINKQGVEAAQNPSSSSSFESAFVGIEPIAKTTPMPRKYINVQTVYLLIHLLPNYFTVEKNFLNIMKHVWRNKRTTNDQTTAEYRKLVSEFIENLKHESVSPDRPPDFLDHALTRVQQIFRFFEISGTTVMLPTAIHRLNALLQGFDILDVSIPQLKESTQKLGRKYGVVVPVVYASNNTELDFTKPQDRAASDSFLRGSHALVFMGMANSNVRDLYNVYVAPDLRLFSIADVLRSHACDNVFLLNLLANMTRINPYLQGSVTKYSDLDVFVRAVEVIYTGKYPFEISNFSEYMSAKKRILCLRVAQMYVELQFSAFLKFGLILYTEHIINTLAFWQSFFWTLPHLLKRLLSTATNNPGLAKVPMYLFLDLVRQLEIDEDKSTYEYTTPNLKPYMCVANPVYMALEFIDMMRNVHGYFPSDTLLDFVKSLERIYGERLLPTFQTLWRDMRDPRCSRFMPNQRVAPPGDDEDMDVDMEGGGDYDNHDYIEAMGIIDQIGINDEVKKEHVVRYLSSVLEEHSDTGTFDISPYVGEENLDEYVEVSDDEENDLAIDEPVVDEVVQVPVEPPRQEEGIPALE